MSTTVTRCYHCNQNRAVRNDGRVRKHRNPATGESCVGSEQSLQLISEPTLTEEPDLG